MNKSVTHSVRNGEFLERERNLGFNFFRESLSASLLTTLARCTQLHQHGDLGESARQDHTLHSASVLSLIRVSKRVTLMCFSFDRTRVKRYTSHYGDAVVDTLERRGRIAPTARACRRMPFARSHRPDAPTRNPKLSSLRIPARRARPRYYCSSSPHAWRREREQLGRRRSVRRQRRGVA